MILSWSTTLHSRREKKVPTPRDLKSKINTTETTEEEGGNGTREKYVIIIPICSSVRVQS